jgi:uncharacterized protein YqcC (DUF446 family)
MTINVSLIPLLDQLETELRTLTLWQPRSPNQDALNSVIPFAMDTLAPHQWLQWVFIPKIRHALLADNPPRGFSLEPYFAEAWQGQSEYTSLLTVIKQIDMECQ